MLDNVLYFIRCLRLRKVLGGGMRQSGVLAAAAMVALDEASNKLKTDHHHAQMLAKGDYCYFME